MSLPAESSPRSRTWPASLNATSVTTTALPSPSSGPTVTPHAVLVLIPFHMLQATRISQHGDGVPRSNGLRRNAMPLNHFVTLGRSGLRVSPFCLGGMTFGEERGWGSSVAVSEEIIDRYLDCGGNFIDSANSYNRGHSEKIIGDHIGCYPARRDRIVIATKFSFSLYPGDPNAGGASRKSIVAACEESLRRLRTGYIDLYWMHYWDRFTPIDETMRALEDLVTAGKVRYLGFSDSPAWKVAQA